jgi:hypothetical protein
MRSLIYSRSRKLHKKASRVLGSRLVVLCALLIVGVLRAQTPEEELGKDRIVTEELDPSKPIIVRTIPTVTTTVQFPEPIDALDGKGMVVDENKDLGRFQIAWQQGSRFVSIMPLVDSGSMNINVITGGKVYVMLVIVDVRFDWVIRLVPQGSLELVQNLLAQQQAQEKKKALMPDKPAEPEIMTPAKAISLLDKCIMFPLLEQTKPEATEGIYHRYNVGTITSYKQFDVELLSVFRHEALDAVVFRVRFIPKQREAFYDPRGFGVRVGHDYYQQFTSKASGEVVSNPADPRENEAWFMIVGTGMSGERNNLAVTNTFLVNVPPMIPGGGESYQSRGYQGEGKEIVTPGGS